MTLISIKALFGGFAVTAFSLIGQAGHPKRFAGLFSAAPSVTVVILGTTLITKRADGAIPYAQGMLIGSAGLLAYCLVSLYLIERLHTLVGSIVAWLAWLLVAGGLYFLFRMTGLFVKQDRLLMKSR